MEPTGGAACTGPGCRFVWRSAALPLPLPDPVGRGRGLAGVHRVACSVLLLAGWMDVWAGHFRLVKRKDGREGRRTPRAGKKKRMIASPLAHVSRSDACVLLTCAPCQLPKGTSPASSVVAWEHHFHQGHSCSVRASLRLLMEGARMWEGVVLFFLKRKIFCKHYNSTVLARKRKEKKTENNFLFLIFRQKFNHGSWLMLMCVMHAPKAKVGPGDLSCCP